jgi:predicted membrane protein
MANYSKPKSNNDGGLIFGFIILGLGVLLLLRKIGIFYPSWLLSWPMILIVIGLVVSIKHQFKSFFGFIMLFFGVYFLLEREFYFDFGLENYLLPLGLIALGIYLITQKQKEKRIMENVQQQMHNKQFKSSPLDSSDSSSAEAQAGSDEPKSNTSDGAKKNFQGISGISYNDRVNIDAIFSGVNKRVLSKKFEGGKLTAAFGGIDLDLTQADFSGTVYLQIDVIFGGTKILVPPHWDVRVEITNIAAGVEDKRMYSQTEVDPEKVLVLRGTCFFGGLEIRSF